MPAKLPQALQRYIDRKIAAGDFRTRDEVVREAIRLMQKRDRALERLRAMIQEGLDDLDAGRVHRGDTSFYEGVMAEGRARRRARAQRKSA